MRFLLLSLLLLTTTIPAHAGNNPMKGMNYQEREAYIRSLSDSEKRQLFAQQESFWNKLSRSEKIANINKNRHHYKNISNAEWARLSGTEKIAITEQIRAYKRNKYLNE